MHGRSSWTCKGGDEKERCWKTSEEKSGFERAILFPFECFCLKNGISREIAFAMDLVNRNYVCLILAPLNYSRR